MRPDLQQNTPINQQKSPEYSFNKKENSKDSHHYLGEAPQDSPCNIQSRRDLWQRSRDRRSHQTFPVSKHQNQTT